MKPILFAILFTLGIHAATVTSITCSGQTATVNSTAHGLIASQGFSLSGTGWNLQFDRFHRLDQLSNLRTPSRNSVLRLHVGLYRHRSSQTDYRIWISCEPGDGHSHLELSLLVFDRLPEPTVSRNRKCMVQS